MDIIITMVGFLCFSLVHSFFSNKGSIREPKWALGWAVVVAAFVWGVFVVPDWYASLGKLERSMFTHMTALIYISWQVDRNKAMIQKLRG